MRFDSLISVFLVLFVILGISKVQSQVIAPVQITPQLLPPYSVYLEDYAQTGIEKLRLILLQRDLSVPSYQIRLRMSLKFNGREIIRTSNNFVPVPILVEAGLPVLISGSDLSPYLSSNSWEVLNGFNLAQYQATKALPEGSYEMCFSAYDFSRPDVLVSNVGCSFYYLSKSEPPLLNLPACGTNIPLQTPQQILFSWTPLNTGSINSSGETEYELSLYEIRPKGRNPNDVAQSTPPIFTTTTEIPQYIYGIADPPLIDSLEYAWRVRAKDKSGRDAFRNQGYSVVCDFKYGGLPANFRVGVPVGLKGKGINERTGEWRWQVAEADTFDLYKIQYKKVGNGWEWFSREVSDSSFRSFEFEADKEYEARVQGKYKGVWGNYTDVVKLRTKANILPKCGEMVSVVDSLTGKPLLEAKKGMVIRVEGFDMRITEVTGSNGYFSGKGKIGFTFGLAQFTNDVNDQMGNLQNGINDIQNNVNGVTGGNNPNGVDSVFNVANNTLGNVSNQMNNILDKMPYLNVNFKNLYISENREANSSGRIEFESKGVDALMGEINQTYEQYKIHKEKQQLNQDTFGDLSFFDDMFVYDFAITSVVVNANGDVLINGQVVNTAIKSMRLGDSTKTVIIEDKNGDQWIIKPDGTVVKAPGGGLPPLIYPTLTPEQFDLLKKGYEALVAEYPTTKMTTLKNTAKQKENVYLNIEKQRKESLGIVKDSVSTEENLVFGVEEIETTSSDTLIRIQDNFPEKTAYIQALDEYSFGGVMQSVPKRERKLRQFCQATAPILMVENIPFIAYFDKAKKDNIPEATQIMAVKIGLSTLWKSLIKQFVTDKFNQK